MLTMMYSSILRSTTHVKLPMYVSLVTVCMNIMLNYLLFGHFGFPEWGLKGSVIATVISPVYVVYLVLSLEEVVGFMLGFTPICSKKWIKNLVKDMSV